MKQFDPNNMNEFFMKLFDLFYKMSQGGGSGWSGNEMPDMYSEWLQVHKGRRGRRFATHNPEPETTIEEPMHKFIPIVPNAKKIQPWTQDQIDKAKREREAMREENMVNQKYVEDHLRINLAMADVVVFWMDYDKAGENI